MTTMPSRATRLFIQALQNVEERRLLKSLDEHSYTSVQAQLPQYLAHAIEVLQSTIPKSDVYLAEGLEDDPHITVKYGLHTNDYRDVEDVLRLRQKPIELTMGETAIFECEDYDVLYVRVYSSCLHELNAIISANLEVTDTHPEYIPHATVAYLKKGLGAKYVGRQDLNAQSATLYSVAFCTKSETKVHLLLQSATLSALGGPGSGNFGHGGRPGEVGGSASTEWPEGLTKVGEAQGSNPGGLYKDKNGQKWYVKNYRDPLQGAGEQVSNNVYRAVGIRAPVSVLGAKGRYASKWEDDAGKTLGREGLTQANADAVLDGFVADVFLVNWDAVGTGHDNVLVKGSKVTRVDQGGTLLHRAQGALKPEGALTKLGEWDALSNPQMNGYYAKVFKKAGVEDGNALGQRAIDQIDNIVAAKPKGGWSEFVAKHAPEAGADYAKKIGNILDVRQELLLAKKAELQSRVHRAAGGPGSGNYSHAGRPGEVGGSEETGTGGGKFDMSSQSIKVTAKQKHTKDQIALAIQMKNEGATNAMIQKETGLHPSTQYHHYNKYLKSKEKIAQELVKQELPTQTTPEQKEAIEQAAKDYQELNKQYEKDQLAKAKDFSQADYDKVQKEMFPEPTQKQKDAKEIQDYDDALMKESLADQGVEEVIDNLPKGEPLEGMGPGETEAKQEAQKEAHAKAFDEFQKLPKGEKSLDKYDELLKKHGGLTAHDQAQLKLQKELEPEPQTSEEKEEFGDFTKQEPTGKPYWKKDKATGKYVKTWPKKAKGEKTPDPVLEEVTKLGVTKKVEPKEGAPKIGDTPHAWDAGNPTHLVQANDLAKANGYEWKEKTTGPNAGKYAWFDGGVQISAPGMYGEPGKTAMTMNYGAGPKSKMEESAETPEGWPIDNNIVREMGKNYSTIMDNEARKWEKTLTSTERQAVKSYTNTAYEHINQKLWNNPKIEEGSTTHLIQKALNKAPTPPPPELVWRGVKGGGLKVFQGLSPGDEVTLGGFQSSAISPSKAKGWAGSNGTVLEIKPKKGGYVDPWSANSGEREYIMPHGSKFRIVGTRTIKLRGDYDFEKKETPMTMRVIQLEML